MTLKEVSTVVVEGGEETDGTRRNYWLPPANRRRRITLRGERGDQEDAEYWASVMVPLYFMGSSSIPKFVS